MILSLTLNPCVDQVLVIDGLKPHDTNRVVRVEEDAGGKGVNLSRVVAEMGGDTVASGFLGGNPGLLVRGVLAEQGVRNSFVEVKGTTRTNVSVEDGSGRPPTTFNARGPQISEEELHRLLGWFEELAPQARWIAMGGSLPPGVPVEIFARLIEVAHAAGARVLLDADGEAQRHGMRARPDMVKPNSHECARLLERPIETDTDALAAVDELYAQLGGGEKIALISRGKRGAVMRCGEGRFFGHSPEVEAKSTIGSGDSLLGALLWSLEQGKPASVAFRWGLAAGAATAMTDGCDIARRATVESLFEAAVVTEA
ncbi:MAG: 1-phosphofructokinase family hexose kinase [Fimbriimonas sp.]